MLRKLYYVSASALTRQRRAAICLVMMLMPTALRAAPVEPPPDFVAQWETPGDQETYGMAVGTNSAIYRADGHSGIEYRSPAGTSLGGYAAYILAIDLLGWMFDVAVAPDRSVYAVGITLGTGTPDRLWEWAPGQMYPTRCTEIAGLPRLLSVAVLNDSSLLVAGDLGYVLECSLQGAVRGTWGTQFGYPVDIAVSPLGDVFVSSATAKKIFHCQPNGSLIGSWGSLGSGEGQFSGGYQQIAADGLGNVYVADSGNDRVQKFRSDGTFVCQWGGPGSSAELRLSSPQGIGVNAAGTMVAVSTSSSTQFGRFVRVFQYAVTQARPQSWGALKVKSR